MPGTTDLEKLISAMQPRLNPGYYVFCSLNELNNEHSRHAIMVFKEAEGVTLILPREAADQLGLHYSFVAAWITLQVHSALEAVGLTAAFSTALATNGISANVVAGFYHDHIFVAQEDAERAVQVLESLANERP